MGATLECSGLTDRGKVRRLNEDQFLVAELTKRSHISHTSLPPTHLPHVTNDVRGHLLVVADGMGGVAGGEIASGLAVETITWYVTNTMPWFYRRQDGREQELEAELRVAVEACRRTVKDAASATTFRHMGTTLTLAYVLWPRMYVVHAGDSRCYVVRGGKPHRMTRDHTVAQRAVDAGEMTPTQAERSPLSHTLWNCISGASEGTDPDIYRTTLEPGDAVLLCTDGLTRKLAEEEIVELVRGADTPEAACRNLVAAANDAGGEDNITVVVARVRNAAGPSDTLPDATAFLPAV